AAVSLQQGIAPREIPYNRERLEQVRHALCGAPQEGVAVLIWPYRDLAPSHPAFVAINRLAARGALPMEVRDVDFQPDAPATAEWRQKTRQRAYETVEVANLGIFPEEGLSRGEYCQRLWDSLQELPIRPYSRMKPDDADGDGILDVDDPTLFTPGEPVEWKKKVLSADQDGLLDKKSAKHARRINFTGKKSAPLTDFEADHGDVYDARRGYGWHRDLSQNDRQRKKVPEAYRDTFLFTRDHDTWECKVPNGTWLVTVCVGDSGHEQIGQWVTVEGKQIIKEEATTDGAFLERKATVTVSDQRLTIEIGKPNAGTNTCLNWVMFEPAPQDK
ncbi:MAG: hypothetical protein KDA77_07840, partial [Planctomycetaceae bacterium]|nr:hypothetical protein [Planctomycetaceae bacterium]